MGDAVTSCDAKSPPLREAKRGCARSRATGVFGRVVRGTDTPLTFPVTPPTRPAKCEPALGVPRIHPLEARQRLAVVNPERLPPTGSAELVRRFRGNSPDSRHCFPGSCTGAQLPTWVHAHLVRARSRGAEAIRHAVLRPHAVCRLLQSKRSVSTLADRPNSNTYAAASCRWSNGRPRRIHRPGCQQARGRAPFGAPDSPRLDDRSP